MSFRRRRRALVCRDAVALMTDYLEGALTSSDRGRLESHLATCPYCTEYLAQIRVTIAAAGRVEPGDLSEEALDDLIALYRRWRSD